MHLLQSRHGFGCCESAKILGCGVVCGHRLQVVSHEFDPGRFGVDEDTVAVEDGTGEAGDRAAHARSPSVSLRPWRSAGSAVTEASMRSPGRMASASAEASDADHCALWSPGRPRWTIVRSPV